MLIPRLILAYTLAYTFNVLQAELPTCKTMDSISQAEVSFDCVEHWNDDNFSENLALHEWVIVDFYAHWCPPCRRFSSIFSQVSSELENAVTFVKMDIDTAPITTRHEGIQYIPTIQIYHDGEVVGQKVGFMSLDQLRAFIKEVLDEV